LSQAGRRSTAVAGGEFDRTTDYSTDTNAVVEHKSTPISIEQSPTFPDEFAYRWGSSRPDDDDGDCGFWWWQTRNSASSFGSLQIEGVGGSDVVSMQQPATWKPQTMSDRPVARYRRQSLERLRFMHSHCFITKPLPKSDGLQLVSYNVTNPITNPLTDRV